MTDRELDAYRRGGPTVTHTQGRLSQDGLRLVVTQDGRTRSMSSADYKTAIDRWNAFEPGGAVERMITAATWHHRANIDGEAESTDESVDAERAFIAALRALTEGAS